MNMLIVDDDKVVRDVLAKMAETTQCKKVDLAANGEEALGFATQTAYDLVTLDIAMPEVSGLDIFSVLRGLVPTSVIAIVSGYTGQVTDKEMEFADLAISKPFRVEMIQDLVRMSNDLAEGRSALRKLAS